MDVFMLYLLHKHGDDLKTFLYKKDHFFWLDLTKPSEQDIGHCAIEYNLDRSLMSESTKLGQLPFYKAFDQYDFIILRHFSINTMKNVNFIREFSSKIGIFFNENFIITLHNQPTEILSKVLGKMNFEIDFDPHLIVAELIKETTESYMEPAIELSKRMDVMENYLIKDQMSSINLSELYSIKREAGSCKKLLIYSNESVHDFIKSHPHMERELIKQNEKLHKFYDQILEDAQNLLNIYLSISSQKTNEVMKLLTIFSAFFLPLTFIVGVYGMNFKYIPELDWRMGYPAVMGVMILIVIIIFSWFKRKKII